MNLKPFNKIGIGIAFSPNLKANIHEAARLALFFDCKLILIHVGEKNQDKINTIKSFLNPFIDKKLAFEIEFKSGKPVDVILAVSEQKKIDLLVLGALKRENMVKFYMGSIARKITRNAKCSVLLLINPSVDRVKCQHVVVNGLEDPKTSHTINAAFFVSKKLDATKITIVEEIDKHEIVINVDDDKSLRKTNILKERMRLRENSRVMKIVDTVPEELKEEIKVNTQPIFGKRGYSIGHYAEVVRADLLVMNAPETLGLWDRIIPHDIEHILSELPTDVLIVR